MSIAARASLSRGPLLVMLFGLVFIASGCASEVSYPSGASYAETEGGPFVVENTSQLTICYVKIRPSSDAESGADDDGSEGWGPDQLEVAEVLRTASRRSWHLPSGRYDLRLEDCNHRLLDEVRDLEVTDDGGWFTLHDRRERGG